MQAAIESNPRFFSTRKYSVQPSARSAIKAAAAENPLEAVDCDDYAPTFRSKKMSLQNQGKPTN